MNLGSLSSLKQRPIKNKASVKMNGKTTAPTLNLDIAKERAKNSPEAANIDLYKNLKGSLDEKPRGWQALVAGALDGLEHNEKLKISDRMTESLDALDEYNNSLMRANEWQTQKDFAEKKYKPDVLNYMQNAASMSASDRMLYLKNIFAGYNEIRGTDYDVVSIDGFDPNLITVRSKEFEGTQVMNLRDLFAGDDLVNQAYSDQMPHNIRIREQQQALLNQQQGNLDRNYNLAAKKYDLMEQKEARKAGESNKPIGNHAELPVNERGFKYIPLNELPKDAVKEYGKNVNKQISNITFNVKAIKNIKKMKEIFKGNPKISSSFATIIANSDKPNWMTQLGRTFQNKKDLADAEQLVKLANDLNLAKILDAPGKVGTDIFKQAVAKAAPSGNLTPEAFDAIANDWTEVAKNNISLAEERALGLRNGVMILDKHEMGTNPVNPATENNSDDTVTIRDPDTGETAVIPRKEANVAFAAGWVED